MDEKILQRIIPLIIAVVVLIVQYAIRSQKKKNTATKATIPSEPKESEIFPEIDFNKKMKEKQVSNKKENLEPVVIEKIASKEDLKQKKSPFHTIKQNMKQNMKSSAKNIVLEENAESEIITFTEEELKKAIIYSEILTPKHF